MELTEKEAHCVARLIQGSLFGKRAVDSCAFCKFKCANEKDSAPHLDYIRMKLTEETGVDLGWDNSRIIVSDKIPYRRFLKNSNEKIKERIRNYFQIGSSGALI